MHVYVWEHILSLSSKTAWLILTKLVSDELLMVSYKFYGFKTTSAKGRIQGGPKIGRRGVPASTNFFSRLDGFSNKANA